MNVTTVPETLSFFKGHMGYLQKQGFDIETVASPGTPGALFGPPPDGVFHPLPMSRSIDPRRDAASLMRLVRLFRSRRPDIVHSHTPKAGLLGTTAARAARVPAIMTSVFGLPQMTLHGLKKNLLDLTTRLTCSLAHRVWCDSRSMRDFIVAEGMCPDRKAIVLGKGSVAGVDAENVFSPKIHGPADRLSIRARYGIPAGSVVLGFVGRIARDKGMHELAEAWRGISQEYADLHLLLIGGWDARDPIPSSDERLFRSSPRIHLVGQTKEVAAHLAAMDIFVMPSFREGFGLSNIEASSMELPIVSTRIPGCIDSVQDGLTGTLVPARTISPLAEAIRRYLDDPRLRQEHGRAGRRRVLKDFRPETIWRDLYREYCRLLGRVPSAEER